MSLFWKIWWTAFVSLVPLTIIFETILGSSKYKFQLDTPKILNLPRQLLMFWVITTGLYAVGYVFWMVLRIIWES